MFKRIDPKNVSVRPFKAYKQWSLDQDSAGITAYRGNRDTSSVYYSASAEYSNNVPKRFVYDSINTLYYANQTAYDIVGQTGTYEQTNRTIHDFCNVISIPTRYFGEEIRPGSLQITDSVTGRTYVDDGLGNIVDNSTASLSVGNVIYPHGFVIATHTGSFYSESFTGDFDLTFKSTTTLYEYEVFVEVGEGEFNVSQNPSSYINDSGSSYYGFIRKKGFANIPGEGDLFYNLNYPSTYDTGSNGGFSDYEYSSSIDPTGSYLAPYITTIGLYDDDHNMVAVAKLSEPVKSLPDWPINFVVSFDM